MRSLFLYPPHVISATFSFHFVGYKANSITFRNLNCLCDHINIRSTQILLKKENSQFPRISLSLLLTQLYKGCGNLLGLNFCSDVSKPPRFFSQVSIPRIANALRSTITKQCKYFIQQFLHHTGLVHSTFQELRMH